MIWTNEKPTKPGWYWWRTIGVDCAVVFVHEVETTAGKRYSAGILPDSVASQWSGPIPEPKEPSEDPHS